jgi:hypothetical protein
MSSGGVLESIANQSGVSDMLHIEKVYSECGGDQVATILKLLDHRDEAASAKSSERSRLDEMREICEEKDAIFQKWLKDKGLDS